ncbi:unnamed protein product [Didymodactylos carnosus]|uniref:MATH domain-containing protein n=1 Tax=Didymodactylos carnosus TaxID=1234261 RepID=A0A814M3R8_9BILA|nr:unnamed protein product [Didymodactylos carnosus]CAF3840889.1 unnamed protein product [Didymodactylos carnosus]
MIRAIGQLHVTCKEKSTGCEWTGMLNDYQVIRFEFENHLLTEQHQRSLLAFLEKIQQLIIIFKFKQPLTTNSSTFVTVKQEPMEYETMESQQLATALKVTNSESNEINQLLSELQKCYDLLTILTQGIQTLENDTTRLSTESIRVNSLMQSIFNELNQLKSIKIHTIDTCLASKASSQESLQQELSIIKQKVKEIEFMSYDSTLIWKVTNVTDKTTDAQSERETSIYSPVFYSSPIGYKMCARLYLNGDGNARRTHMSLFFVLMKGDYDGILKWPLNCKVTFCLFDQTGQNRHVIDSFRPDTKSNSCQRPRPEMNIASGIPKFFPLPMIRQDNNNYVIDNTMFIKIIVDFSDLPIMILPYALSLNPGLPHHIQQHLIEKKFNNVRNNQTQLQL